MQSVMVFYSLAEQGQFICSVLSSMVHIIDPQLCFSYHSSHIVIRKSTAYKTKKVLSVTFALFCKLFLTVDANT